MQARAATVDDYQDVSLGGLVVMSMVHMTGPLPPGDAEG